MNYAGKSHTGKERKVNEDGLLVLENEPYYLFAVADGMGGHAAGEVASSLALENISKFLAEKIVLLSNDVDGKLPHFIEEMILNANHIIWNASREDIRQQGMGTTLTLAVVHGRVIVIGHVGDSRAYLVDDKGIQQITRDHSLVEELVDKGQLTREEVRLHPQRNVLTKALGTDAELNCEVLTRKMEQGDIFLLCTDGLTSLVNENEIFGIVSKGKDYEKSVEAMIELANLRGGFDNITAVLFSF